MATNPIRTPAHVKTRSGQGPVYEKLTIVASLIAGEQLLKANNAVAACADAGTIVTHVMPQKSADVIPGQTLSMPLIVAQPGDVWEVTAYHSTPSLAVVADSLLDAQAGYGIIKPTVSSKTEWCLDLENTSQKIWRLIDRPAYLNNTATDLYPRVWVQYINTVTQAT